MDGYDTRECEVLTRAAVVASASFEDSNVAEYITPASGLLLDSGPVGRRARRLHVELGVSDYNGLSLIVTADPPHLRAPCPDEYAYLAEQKSLGMAAGVAMGADAGVQLLRWYAQGSWPTAPDDRIVVADALRVRTQRLPASVMTPSPA